MGGSILLSVVLTTERSALTCRGSSVCGMTRDRYRGIAVPADPHRSSRRGSGPPTDDADHAPQHAVANGSPIRPLNKAKEKPPCVRSLNDTRWPSSWPSPTSPARRSSRFRRWLATGLGIIDLELPRGRPVRAPAISLAGAASVTTALAEDVTAFGASAGGVASTGQSRLVCPRVGDPAGAALATAVVFAGVEPVVKLVTSPGIVIGAVLGSVVAFVLVNLWEEAAWTGFALERLQPRPGRSAQAWSRRGSRP